VRWLLITVSEPWYLLGCHPKSRILSLDSLLIEFSFEIRFDGFELFRGFEVFEIRRIAKDRHYLLKIFHMIRSEVYVT